MFLHGKFAVRDDGCLLISMIYFGSSALSITCESMTQIFFYLACVLGMLIFADLVSASGTRT
jgi:hypothetical protein